MTEQRAKNEGLAVGMVRAIYGDAAAERYVRPPRRSRAERLGSAIATLIVYVIPAAVAAAVVGACVLFWARVVMPALAQ